ncbi:Transcription factor RLM1 [Zalerion maritima]|uniref:MADS-box MEF2 type transcription factor MIG1 n=1 Tax=Zalerion maritima TaxID=339359 RepID=A0AAD5RWF0_9PEZI|nr:Transcription factor RLM1 [Zalerion maritima]
MGRRKIEIKAIKDDRNRSVTFLKRKGGLFKKAHELSVLCSVDVAVVIFGSNKKLYEYSSSDMRDLVTRWSYHGGPNEHKGPSDFNGGQDDEDEDDENGTPPNDPTAMLPPHFQGQPPFSHMRHHTPSASPPIPPNGVFPHPVQRGHTPQPPHMGSRPGSRNDMRRMGPGMVPPPVGPPVSQAPGVNGYAYMPQPAIYGNQPIPPNSMPPNSMPQPAPYGSYAPAAPMQPYPMEEQRRASIPPPQNFPPPQAPQPQQIPRSEPSPPQSEPQQLPPQPIPQINVPAPSPSPTPGPQPQPQPEQARASQAPEAEQQPAMATAEPKLERMHPKPKVFLNTNTEVKRMPGRKQQSIFTPIEEARSILSQHLAAFQPMPKPDQAGGNRSQSIDSAIKPPRSPPPPQRSNTGFQPQRPRNESVASLPEKAFSPPSRSNSLRVGGVARPRLTVQIPDDEDNGSATAESSSPRNSTDVTSQTTRGNSHSSGVVLPPPSPSASTLLSAGATGPPNPFARPPPSHIPQPNSDNTPVSALPSRFLHGEFLPSPSSFYPDWNSSNTLPSPLNFATPVVGTGPSFLRDDASTASGPANGKDTSSNNNSNPNKRKSPEASGPAGSEGPEQAESKRVKVD